MDQGRSKTGSSDAALSSVLSSYILSDPPFPSSALPSILKFLASSRPLSTSQASHKWNTRISSLLQSKSAESRYWGICLAKATINTGGEGTTHAVTWSKLLLAILNRPEAPAVLDRVIATLTDVFGLIQTHATLSRDLSALLPTFFTALLNLSNQPALMKPVLIALHMLIPDHPNVFRPNLSRTSAMVLSLLDGQYPPDIRQLAAHVYVDLHHSAQKGTHAEHWKAGLLGAIAEIHYVLDDIFGIIEEDAPRVSNLKGLGLNGAQGTYAASLVSGLERIYAMVTLVQSYLSVPTKVAVNVPIGHLTGLAARVYSVGLQSRFRGNANSQDIALLMSNLSNLYLHMNTIVLAALKCVGFSFAPHFIPIFQDLLTVVETIAAEDTTLLISTFDLLSQLLNLFGAGLHSSREAKLLNELVGLVLRDLSRMTSATSSTLLPTSKSRKRKHNASQPIDQPTTMTSIPPLRAIAAIRLLTSCLRLTPVLSLSTRTSIDQIVLSLALKQSVDSEVLCALHDSIVTSVMFPAGVAILPHAIQIIERDSAHPIEKVKGSALRAGREIELIVHSRLPTQKRHISSKQVEDQQEEMESVDGIQEDMEMEMENTTELGAEKEEGGILPTEIQTVTNVLASVEPSPWSQPPPPPPSLPSFVRETVASTKNPIASQSTKVENESTSSLQPAPEKKSDVFSRGAWKAITTKDEESDEEIPEIDMGFDTDEGD